MIRACTFAAVCVFAASVSAQDATVRTKTKVEADDAKVVTMTGCLQQGAAGDFFVLSGATMMKGDDLKSKTRTKVDVDKDETEVRTKTKTEVDDQEAVGTSGMVATYELIPKAGLDLTPHVGHRVEVTAVAVEAGKGDADVEMRTETKVERDDARDTKTKSKTSVEVPKGKTPRMTVMSVRHIAPGCSM
jgi:hypothetical protein